MIPVDIHFIVLNSLIAEFKMAVETCCSKITPEIDKAVESIVKKERFIYKRQISRMVSTEGGNYLGELYEVDINGKTPDGEKEINLFIKKIVPEAIEKMKDFFDINDAYSRELFMYKELKMVFIELEDQANIPQEDRFRLVKGYEECFGEAIIMENLTKQGYTTSYRMDVITYEFAKLSMQQIAKFHALSLALKKLRPSYFEKKIKNLKYLLMSTEGDDKPIKFMYDMMSKSANHINDPDLRKKVEDILPPLANNWATYFDNNKTPIHTLCHSDFRQNNILMKEIDGVVDDIILVDYQCITYGCPAIDILYFMYTSTDQAFRNEHFEDLKNIYYDTVSRFLQYFDMDFSEMLSRKGLDALIEDWQGYGLNVSLQIFAFLFAKENNTIDLAKDNIDDWECEMDERFQSRIKEVIEECYDAAVKRVASCGK